MLKKFLLLICAAALLGGFPGCSKKKPVVKPGGLTAEQREKLKKNAIKFYGSIVKEYPDSPHAAEAKQRLQALSPKDGK